MPRKEFAVADVGRVDSPYADRRFRGLVKVRLQQLTADLAASNVLPPELTRPLCEMGRRALRIDDERAAVLQHSVLKMMRTSLGPRGLAQLPGRYVVSKSGT